MIYVCLGRITIDLDEKTESDKHRMRDLLTSIRSNFKVSVSSEDIDQTDETIIAVAILSRTEDEARQKIDSISDLCESSGYGRVVSEELLIEQFAVLFDEEGQDDA